MKKTKKYLLVLLPIIIFLSLFNSCNQDEFVDKPGEPSIPDVSSASRITHENRFIPVVNNNNLKSVDLWNKNSEWIFTLVAEVEPPVSNGSKLQATHVEILDDNAYISYNKRGSDYVGAIDIINISDPDDVQMVETLLFGDKDVNTVLSRSGNIIFAGQDPNGAFIAEYNVNNDETTYTTIDSYSPVGMDLYNDTVYVAAGDEGGIFVWYDNEIIRTLEIDDARSVKVAQDGSDKLYVLTGNGIYEGTLMGDFNTIIQSTTIQTASKADLELHEDYLFGALNKGGLYINRFSDNAVGLINPPITPSGYNEEDFVTNSASYNDSLLFIANGGAGILVSGETDHLKSSNFEDLEDLFEELGYFDFGETVSSNFVTSREDVIFVASGLGGLKILTFEDSGLPDDFQPGVVCETLFDSIIEMFPERNNAIEAHPQFFDDTFDHRVITESETEVWAQFVWEGAGWKNTFGYYTYELGNEPTTAEEIQENIIFPNVSGSNEGGGLLSGDMVFLGEFPENTVIGFYLVAKGWDGEIVPGTFTHYTDFNLNSNSAQQHVLFTENACSELVLGFEDQKVGNGDDDFNDIIITIKDNGENLTNLETSFNTENVASISFQEETE